MLAGRRFIRRDQKPEFGHREPERYRALQGSLAAERTSLAGNDQHVPQAALMCPDEEVEEHAMGFALDEAMQVYPRFERQMTA